jgi:tritrans,polycis-undecaprenyl-diphosphate synthase [geranylgeranyl-diphosphate specific]
MKINTVLYMPDGNRRFARKNQIPLDEAYQLGAKTLGLFSDFFVAGGLAKNFVYHAMSKYTHQRTDLSLGPIYKAIEKSFENLNQERFFERNSIQFQWIDHSGKLPRSLEDSATKLAESSKTFEKGKVIALLGYSYEDDINTALSQNPINYQEFRKNLIFPEDIDLVIRPFEMRASGGPVYAMNQSQMITLDKLNPEVRKGDLEEVMQQYVKLKDFRFENSHNPIHQK